MKEQKNALEFYGLLLIMAAAVAFLSAGTAMAEQGGLPACMDNLNTCTTDLDTCLNDLAQAQGNSTTNQTGTNLYRFTDNGDGTVTDNLTGLVWMKNAKISGLVNWPSASDVCDYLEEGGDLTDGSSAGDWRLPDIKELQSLIDYEQSNPAVPPDHPFVDVQSSTYWSSTTFVGQYDTAWYVSFYFGTGFPMPMYDGTAYVWCVRDGNIN